MCFGIHMLNTHFDPFYIYLHTKPSAVRPVTCLFICSNAMLTCCWSKYNLNHRQVLPIKIKITLKPVFTCGGSYVCHPTTATGVVLHHFNIIAAFCNFIFNVPHCDVCLLYPHHLKHAPHSFLLNKCHFYILKLSNEWY